MITFFWDYKTPVLDYCMPRGTIISSETYRDLLENYLKPIDSPKRHGLLTSGMLLQHDNEWHHKACVTA